MEEQPQPGPSSGSVGPEADALPRIYRNGDRGTSVPPLTDTDRVRTACHGKADCVERAYFAGSNAIHVDREGAQPGVTRPLAILEDLDGPGRVGVHAVSVSYGPRLSPTRH